MRRALVNTAAALLCGGLMAGIGVGTATAADSSTTTPDSSTSTPAPLPDVASTTTTLPLFGAPLTVELTSGPGGALTSVALNPADGYTASTVKPNKVVFVNEDGSAKVIVNNRHGGQRVEARAGSFEDIVGPGSWSGDVFGTGAVTNVSFEIVATDGVPDITNVNVSGEAAEVGTVEQDFHNGGNHAKLRIRFTNGTQTRTLTIKVLADPDGPRPAMVKITLSRVKGTSLPAAEVAGPQAWSGVLCDGTTAQIAYNVAEDGSVSDVTVSPEPEKLSSEGNRIRVRFSGGERVTIKVRAKNGELKISVDEKIRCDAPPPEVNTEIDPDAEVSGSEGRADQRRGGQGDGDDHRDRGRGGHDDDHDDRHDGDDGGRRGGRGGHGRGDD